MKEMGRERVMVELDDDATDGQASDYEAAELSGDFGEWGVTSVTYECKKCGNIVFATED